ncbi:putative phage replisome organizer [Acetoanaerobium pronyense]|uniref:Phage replisome organizer n=1 Tax=Acetoanaerobium pronyense TaxID=1482736 RepID=A0ABS4KI24_9FIRM|nr:phage replisome organizer N-terminal domain-containing protein [Acetoanaerobium pronyense]MBP2027430.1 putative phage replisome organizer [Acetoanaerobium pronyense]
MSEIKWIKITTGMFQDEKIDFIESLPEADAILIIWIKLLTLAGKCNANGFILLTENIPYTDEMLANRFKKPLTVIKLALKTFQNLNMIKMEGPYIKISNWEKHQNIEGMEKIKEQTRNRVAKYREKQKLLPENSCNATCNATVTQCNATDIDKELDIEIDKDNTINKLSKDNLISIIQKWNDLGLSQIKTIKSNQVRYKLLKTRINEYGFEEVIKAIENIKKSNFLQGDNKNCWVITFDWMVKPSNFVKVLEGAYNNNTNKKNLNNQKITRSNIDEDVLKQKLKEKMEKNN